MSILNWWNNNTNSLLNNLNNNFNITYPAFDYDNISKKFLEEYYKLLYSNHKSLYNLYMLNAKLTYDNIEYLGIDSIKQKYNELELKEPKYTINNYNSQPLDTNKILITLFGLVENKLNNNILSFNITHKNNFYETIILININNSWFIQNHIVKII